MLKRVLSSQLRINMVSGVVATVVNVVVLAIAYPIYLYFEICIQAMDVNRLVK